MHLTLQISFGNKGNIRKAYDFVHKNKYNVSPLERHSFFPILPVASIAEKQFLSCLLSCFIT